MSSDPFGASPLDDSGMVLSSASRFGDKWMASHELSPLAKGLELLVPLAKGAAEDRAAVAQLMGRWIVHATRENLNEAAELLLAMQETFALGEDEFAEDLSAEAPGVDPQAPAAAEQAADTGSVAGVKLFGEVIAEAAAAAQAWRETNAVPELARACSLLEDAAQCDDADEQAAEDLFHTWEQQAKDLDDEAAIELLGAFRTALTGDGEAAPPSPGPVAAETPLQHPDVVQEPIVEEEVVIPPMAAVTHTGPVTARDIEEWISADNLAALVDQYPLLASISLKRRVIDWAVPVAKEGRPAPLLEIGAMEENPALVKHLNALVDAAPPEEIGRFIEIDGMPKTQKRMAAVILGQCKTPASEGMLVRLLRDASPLVRSAAAMGLGHQGREGAVAALKRAVREDQAAGVRAAAAKGLAQIGNKTALVALEEAVVNTSPSREVEVALRDLKIKVHKPAPSSAAVPVAEAAKAAPHVEKKKKPIPVDLIIKLVVVLLIIAAAGAYAYKTWKKYDVYNAPRKNRTEVNP